MRVLLCNSGSSCKEKPARSATDEQRSLKTTGSYRVLVGDDAWPLKMDHFGVPCNQTVTILQSGITTTTPMIGDLKLGECLSWLFRHAPKELGTMGV